MIKTPLSTVIGGAFWTPSATILGGTSKTFNQLIKSLFANNEQGFAYDPNDLTTMFQDAEGTIPVTGAGQTVGLILDKSKGLVVGSERVINGGFTNGLVGWTVNSTVTLNRDTAIFNDGGAKLTVNTSVSTYFYANLGSNFVVGKRYIASADVYTPSTNSVNSVAAIGFVPTGLWSNTVKQQNTDVVERITIAFVATSTTHTLYCSVVKKSAAAWGDLGDIAYFDNISVRELAGQPAYQTTSSMRPLLVASPQRLDYDTVDDKLITTLATQLTGCTVVRAVPNVGTQILTGQTIHTTYNDNTDHCGLIVINRALTPSETSAITREFNKRAGV